MIAIWLGGILVFCGGIFASVQAGANGALHKALNQPLMAAVVSSAGNFVVYLLVIPFLGFEIPGATAWTRVPWWAWVGITFGAINTLNSVYFADRLGSGTYIGIVTTASIISSVALDNFGMAGFAQHTASLGRIAGCGLMLIGLAMVVAL